MKPMRNYWASPVAILLSVVLLGANLNAAIGFCYRGPIYSRSLIKNVKWQFMSPEFRNDEDGPNFDFPTRNCIVEGFERWRNHMSVTVDFAQGLNGNVFVLKGAPAERITGNVPENLLQKNGNAIEKAYVVFPSNIAELSEYDCERIRRTAMHELGHTFGADEANNLPPNTTVMKQAPGTTNAANLAALDAMPSQPTCGDDATIELARSFFGPGHPQYGPVGSPVDCGGLGGWTDEFGCCQQPPPLAFEQSVGFEQRRPFAHIHAPENGQVFSGPATFTASVHALDLDGDAYRVDWLIDGQTYQVQQRSGGNTLSRWNTSITLPARLTPYTIQVAAYDRTQAYSMSQAVSVTVNPPASGPSVLSTGGILYANQYRTSPNGLYTLIYQTDGNLVLYGPAGPIIWTGTYSAPGGVYMNPSGNLEVYNSAMGLMWQSGTAAGTNNGAYLRVQDNGTVGLVRPSGVLIAQWP